ncbi:hypothetical protein VP01_711g2 [Puccinia sorghi]|uniref:Uncharacterized protein n=1 Tax=Puccinia sorghi TaxID=27349 RepID=A0A0L6UDL4_9BASI|nr:hypothetical protein VP01_711g2 [Puccinia sorghi]
MEKERKKPSLGAVTIPTIQPHLPILFLSSLALGNYFFKRLRKKNNSHHEILIIFLPMYNKLELSENFQPQARTNQNHSDHPGYQDPSLLGHFPTQKLHLFLPVSHLPSNILFLFTSYIVSQNILLLPRPSFDPIQMRLSSLQITSPSSELIFRAKEFEPCSSFLLSFLEIKKVQQTNLVSCCNTRGTGSNRSFNHSLSLSHPPSSFMTLSNTDVCQFDEKSMLEKSIDHPPHHSLSSSFLSPVYTQNPKFPHQLRGFYPDLIAGSSTCNPPVLKVQQTGCPHNTRYGSHLHTRCRRVGCGSDYSEFQLCFMNFLGGHIEILLQFKNLKNLPCWGFHKIKIL